MLRLDCEPQRTLLAEIVALPQTLEQIEAELPPKRFLDHFAVAFTRACAPNLDRAQDFLVDGQRGSHLGHIRIISS